MTSCHNCGVAMETSRINVKVLKPDGSMREMDFCGYACIKEWNEKWSRDDILGEHKEGKWKE